MPLYASQDSPAELLASFYNAINRQEYQRAYGYWETPPSPYDQFAQGYADTASVQLIVQPPTFIDAGAGNLHAAIPTVLVATKRDGSQQRFGGCYTTHKVNIQPDVWHLSQAQIAPLDASASIPAAAGAGLRGVWRARAGAGELRRPEHAGRPAGIVLQRDQSPGVSARVRLLGDTAQPYDQFAQGYADTASVQLIVQLPAFIDAGAGNLHATIPTVLIATQTRRQPADLRRLLHHAQSQHPARCLASRTRDDRASGSQF